MTTTSRGGAGSKPDFADSPLFQKAIQDYMSKFDKKPKRTQFLEEAKRLGSSASGDDVQQYMTELAAKCKTRKARRLFEDYLGPVAKHLEHYGKAIDQIFQGVPDPGSVIWGAVRVFMTAAQEYQLAFERITDQIEALDSLLKRMPFWEDVYSHNMRFGDHVRWATAKTYTTIIEFWWKATKNMKHNQFVQVVKASVKDTKLDAILERLRKETQILETICDAAEQELQANSRAEVSRIDEKVLEVLSLATAEFDAAEKERDLAKKERQAAATDRDLNANDRKERQTKDIISMLEAGTKDQAGLLQSWSDERLEGTGDWLSYTTQFQDWTSPTNPRPILWLHGEHGAGKSFLCGTALNQLDLSGASCIAYLLTQKDMAVPRDEMLRSLVWQLSLIVCKGHRCLPDEVLENGSHWKTDLKVLQQLFNVLRKHVPVLYIFVDGLDEIEEHERGRRELNWVLEFLMSASLVDPNSLRVWCSSQYNSSLARDIAHYSKGSALEISLSPDHTKKDIEMLLEKRLPEGIVDRLDAAQMMIKRVLMSDVDGNFLYASAMLEELAITKDQHESVAVMIERLPKTIDEYYQRVIERFKKRPNRSGGLPLWKVILSILAYMRRPLQIAELREAIAMWRTPFHFALDETRYIDPRIITDECSPLTRYVQQPGTGENEGTLDLAHSAVGAFLWKQGDLQNPETSTEELLVSSTVIRDCCVAYLLQPCLSGLLQKLGDMEFCDHSGKNIREHHFLSYTTKYWHLHCSISQSTRGSPPDSHILLAVENLLQSDNFQACLQVQSIFVLGHFLVQYDEEDHPESVQENLPDWLSSDDSNNRSLRRQYNALLAEWGHVLRLGVTNVCTGEIDRCFWKTLGSNNFMRNFRSRYSSFSFGSGIESTASTLSYAAFSPSPDGRTIVICALRDEEHNQTHLVTERWVVNIPGQPPKLVKSASIAIPDLLRKSRYFCTMGNQKRAVMPSMDCTPCPTLVDVDRQGLNLRIGAAVLSIEKLCGSSELESFSSDHGSQVYDEFNCRDNFVVRCRRKIGCTWNDGRGADGKQASAGLPDDREGQLPPKTSQEVLKEISTDDESLMSQSVFTDDEPIAWETGDSDDDDDDDDDDIVSELDSEELEQLSEHSDDELTFDKVPLERLDAIISDDSRTTSDAESLAKTIDYLDDTSDETEDASNHTDDMSQTTSADNHTEASSDLDEHEKSKPTRYYPRIERIEEAKEKCCHYCGQVGLRRWLSCRMCHHERAALCWHCFQRRKWCGDTGHQLLEWRQDDPVGVRTWRKQCKPEQMIQVIDTSQSPSKVKLEVRREEAQLLHCSPPAIHPSVPLLAWAASPSALLLSSFSKPRWQKSIRLKPSLVNGRNIAIEPHFSEDGQSLHVAILEAAKTRSPDSSRTLSTRYALLTKLLTLKFKPHPSGRATLTSMTNLQQRVGCIDRPFLTTLPFSWTWAGSHAYFTLSGERLLLLRFLLHSVNRQSSVVNPVTSPTEQLFLPRSAKHRAAHFFPASQSFPHSFIILGPQYGSRQYEPMIVYLKDSDLGEWSRHVAEDECENHPQRRRDGLFEGFDANFDCHIRPFDDAHRDLAARR